ncbi:MAG TPA: dihydroorotate dehydrogenase-like protein [Myxococcota bacterium]|jgi:dihydroorotate dehydrogenase (fumarate)|nr:dihydroorotate dehydrogenase-like protein [Myxococcota bacterium]
MPDLRTRYLGLELRSPLVASSSPLTSDLAGLRHLEACGAGAVVLPSLFEEQLEHEAIEIHRMLESGSESFAEALSYFPELDDYNTGPEHYLELVQKAKASLGIPVIGSLNGFSPGGWIEHARRIEQAGADALELNLYLVAADPEHDAATIEAGYLELVRSLRAAVRIPIALKLGCYFTALAHTARELAAAGADGLVLFNRFYQPDLDLETLDVLPRLSLSTSEEMRLPLRWIAILHGRVPCSLALTTGVHSGEDVVKALLAGADVAMMTSALLEHGAEHLRRVERRLVEWMSEREYESVAQLRGSASQKNVADPTAFERANYLRTLKSYASRFRG